MLKYLLDTNACIVYLKYSQSKVWRKLHSIPKSTVAVCSVVKYELFFGSMKSQNPAQSFLIQETFLNQFESLPFDDRSARLAAEIRADLGAKGQIIGAYDIQIAAIALVSDLTLVTHNVSEFARVANLKFEDWES